jgi:isoleucyl-tRNA synthetase
MPVPAEGDPVGLESWILNEARTVFDEVYKAFCSFEYHRGMSKLTEFLNGDLNSIYFNAIKDCLYCDPFDGERRNSVVRVLSTILESLLGLIAPLFTYTADEVFSHAPDWFKGGRKDIFDLVYTPIPEGSKPAFDAGYYRQVLTAFHAVFDGLKTAGSVRDTLEVV